jgi:hypothetical protein
LLWSGIGHRSQLGNSAFDYLTLNLKIKDSFFFIKGNILFGSPVNGIFNLLFGTFGIRILVTSTRAEDMSAHRLKPLPEPQNLSSSDFKKFANSGVLFGTSVLNNTVS